MVMLVMIFPSPISSFFFFNDTATTEIYTLSLHDALPISSGSYNRQVAKAEQIILFALSRLQPADSIAVARIDTGSFTEKNIIAKATFDDRPSAANQQKRAFASRVTKFAEQSTPAEFTDITG